MLARQSLCLLLIAIFSIVSCKSNPPVDATLKNETAPGGAAQSGDAVTCACGDMQCWRKATNDGVKDQLECAKDAMEKVIPIVGPIADLAINLADEQNGAAGLVDVIKIVEEILKARNNAAGFPNELSCIVDIAVAFEGAFKPFKELDKASKLFTQSPSFENAKSMGDLLKAAYDGAVAFSNILTRENQNCVVDPTKAEHKKWQQKLDTLKTKPRGFFDSFITRSKDLVKSPIDKINVARTIYSCAHRIFKGARTLYNNTQCLIEDLKALEDSKRAVARALAYVGTRQYNYARYIGCSQCVYSSYKDSTETEYRKCRSCCDSRIRRDIGPYQRDAAVNSCQLTCGIARTEGLFWDYTDEAVCNEVKGMFSVSRMFRLLPIVPYTTPEGEQRSVAENTRARTLAALNQLDQFFVHVPGLHNNPAAAGLIEMEDLTLCRDNANFHRELRDACGFFAEESRRDLFALLDSAGDNNPDGKVGITDVRYFRDEVSEYRHDSEYDRADVAGNLKGCADWGASASKSEGWGCDFNRTYQRCLEHAEHRAQTIERTRPLSSACAGSCLQAARAANSCQ